MKLIKTGIVGLDELLNGGVPPEVLLILGEPGSGTEVFVQHVAYARTQETGVSYLTLNKPIEQIRDEILSFGLDIVKHEEDGSWRFLNPHPNKVMETVERELRLKRSIVIDSLSDIIMKGKFEESVSLLCNMSKLNREIQGLHLVLLTKGMHDHKDEIAMQHFAEGVIEFTMMQGTEYITRRMFIKKLRGFVTPIRNFSYSIGKRGIIIETAIRIT